MVEQLPSKLSRKPALVGQQKIGWLVLIISGILTIFIGIKYIGIHLTSPFQSTYRGPEFLTLGEREQKKIEEQKNMDSDVDGLTDYDEIYIYDTSAYIADTDSDGYNDSVEIASGNNPSCPLGQECALVEVDAVQPTLSAPVMPQPVIPGFDANNPAFSLKTPEEIMAYFQSMSAPEIRKALEESGVDPTSFEDLSDQELVDLFNAALREIAAAREEESELPVTFE